MFRSFPSRLSAPLLTVTLVGTACATMGGVAPSFEWDSSYTDRDASLTIVEQSRRSTPGSPMGTIVSYALTADGFDDEDQLTLWYKVGPEYSRLPVTLADDGLLRLQGQDEFSIFGYVAGQPFDVALTDGNGRRAHGKVTPFPIESLDDNGCRLSAEVLNDTGLAFAIAMSGFGSGDSVTVVSEYRDQRIQDVLTMPPDGVARTVVQFERGSSGSATYSANTSRCEVSLEYAVGEEAMVVR